jgi:hypothetical protein
MNDGLFQHIADQLVIEQPELLDAFMASAAVSYEESKKQLAELLVAHHIVDACMKNQKLAMLIRQEVLGL